ncbi:MAG TPA: catalase-related domain-containing protein, partial [Acidimicrobiia bacterium]|nr:catalase-related domain-containing protein [Acidimicrobiia bacterium]
IDFTNDPLLQGRNFSYLDTQLKRLGSPNFTDLPINAPKCPFATFQQDGHMAFVNPTGRVNYEPNSWPGEQGGPREDPVNGFQSFPNAESGEKRRLRPESFADHYSQARQFFVSQTPIEQKHIADAFVFELSKVDTPAIRARMVANLRNVDEDLAGRIADGLRLDEYPDPSVPASAPITDLPPSLALSIVENAAGTFEGRKVGALVTDGADAALIAELQEALAAEGAKLEFVAPQVGGFVANDDTLVLADQKLEGGPSVLFDAVVILASAAGSTALAEHPAARDFVADAFAHCKFVGHVASADPLLVAAGVAERMDEGFVALDHADGVATFVTACRDLRFWDRELAAALALP